MLFKREVWGAIKFPDQREYEDLATMFKLYSNAHKGIATSCRLYGYRQRAGSVMNAQLISSKRLTDYLWAIREVNDSPELSYPTQVARARDARVALESARLKVLLHDSKCDSDDISNISSNIDSMLRDKAYGVLHDKDCPRRLKLKIMLMSSFPGMVQRWRGIKQNRLGIGR